MTASRKSAESQDGGFGHGWDGLDYPSWARDACSVLATELQYEFFRQVTGFRQEMEGRVEQVIEHIASFEGYAQQSLGKLEKMTKSRDEEMAERVARLEERVTQLETEKVVSSMALASLRNDLDRVEAARDEDSASGSDITTAQQVEIFATMEEAIRALRQEHDEIVSSSREGFLRLDMKMDSLGADVLAQSIDARGALDPWMKELDERQYHTAAVLEQLREVMAAFEKTFDDRLIAVESRTAAAGNVIAGHCYSSIQDKFVYRYSGEIVQSGQGVLPGYWPDKDSVQAATTASIKTAPPRTRDVGFLRQCAASFDNQPHLEPATAEDVRYAITDASGNTAASAAIAATAGLLEEVLRQLCPSPAAHQAVLNRLKSRLSLELVEQQ